MRSQTPIRAHVVALICCLAPALGGTGCAFLSSASELTFGPPDVPSVEAELLLTVDTFNQALREAAASTPLGAAAAAPYELEGDDGWINIRSTLCEGWKIALLPRPQLDVRISSAVDGHANIADARLRLEVAADSLTTCYQTALTATGMVDFIMFPEEQAAQIKDSLNTEDFGDLREAIAQIRFSFRTLEFRASGAGANDALSDFGVVLNDPELVDDPATPDFDERYIELIPYFLLGDISPETPQRFELDPESPVSGTIKEAIVNASQMRILRVFARAELADARLADVAIDQSGVALAFDPEIVISALEAVSTLL